MNNDLLEESENECRLSSRKRLDDVIADVAGYGRYQIIACLSYSFPRVFSSCLILVVFFTYASPDHRCVSRSWPNDTWAAPNATGLGKSNKCNALVHPASLNVSALYITESHKENETMEEDGNYKKCDRWLYDTTYFESTIVSTFNLVCDNNLKASHGKALYFLGNLLGSTVIGFISDAYGRRTAVILSLLCMITSSLGIAFAHDHYTIMGLLVVLGAGTIASSIAILVFTVENLPPTKRVRPGFLFTSLFTVGYLMAALVTYFARRWWVTYLVMCGTLIISLVCSMFFPESVRWLVAKGRIGEAEKEFRRMARCNRAREPIDFTLDDVILDQKERNDWRTLLKSKKLRRSAAIICINWFTVAMVYYGLTITSVNMLGNPYVNSVFLTLADIVSCIFCYHLLDRMGRTRLNCVSMIIGGVFLFFSMFPSFFGGADIQYLTLVLITIAKVALTTSFSTIYYMTTELFPTNARSFVLGIASACARVGSMVTPYFADMSVSIDAKYGRALPLVVFGTAAVTAGLLALKLPDTSQLLLPDSVTDGEMLGMKTKDAVGDMSSEQVSLASET